MYGIKKLIGSITLKNLPLKIESSLLSKLWCNKKVIKRLFLTYPGRFT
jgi:hypothetical protein